MNRKKLIAKLRDRDFRREFAEAAIDVGIPVQIREMRLANRWSQARLGKETGMAQEQVSLAEKLNYGRFTLSTLKKLAAAFDCALIVRFAPFSELLNWKSRIDSADVTPPSFDGDFALSFMGRSEPLVVEQPSGWPAFEDSDDDAGGWMALAEGEVPTAPAITESAPYVAVN
ncbi:MAG TPA: helix-turn-helix transcriptional regulator [Thermoanaerobaculia bacterium]|nr:helix-turn-helix transcriptional regulator [Thermoanaerobaculia bacterium]